MKIKYLCILVCFLVAVVILVFPYISHGVKMADEASLLGQRAPDWTLKSFSGEVHALQGILRQSDTKAIIVAFIATRCPVSKAYDARMEKIYQDYKDKGVVFVGINSNCNPMESENEMKEHAERVGLTFPILKDHDNMIADKYGARVTPHIYLLDSEGTVRYIGRIDDSQDQEKVKSRDLIDALDAVLAGKEVNSKLTSAFGCTIKRM